MRMFAKERSIGSTAVVVTDTTHCASRCNDAAMQMTTHVVIITATSSRSKRIAEVMLPIEPKVNDIENKN